MAKTFIEHSRTNWYNKNDDGTYPGDINIQIGLMQRIADSLERMEKPYLQLITDLTYYKSRTETLSAENKMLNKRIAGLKGVVTRMKRKMK